MKTKILFFISLIFIQCDSESHETKLVNDFVKEVLLEVNSPFSSTNKFISYNVELENNIQITSLLIEENIKDLYEKLKKNGFEYQIASHQEIKNLKISINFKYDDLSKVYHLISKGEIITSFIVEDGRIISFSYNLIKNRNHHITPFILN